jgi:death-on-curing protein
MPVWIDKAVVLIWHNELLAEHGGAPGVRDEGLLESALARPRNLHAYSEQSPSLFRLAAAYAGGILRNHPFIDGNKRTALVVAIAFLELNSVTFSAPQQETHLTFLELAARRVSESKFASWLQRHSVPLE